MADKKPDWITENPDGGVTVTLLRGMNVNGTKVTKLTMREPTVNDDIAAGGEGSNAMKEVSLLANLTMQSPDDIRTLTLRDYGRLQTALTGFLG